MQTHKSFPEDIQIEAFKTMAAEMDARIIICILSIDLEIDGIDWQTVQTKIIYYVRAMALC